MTLGRWEEVMLASSCGSPYRMNFWERAGGRGGVR